MGSKHSLPKKWTRGTYIVASQKYLGLQVNRTLTRSISHPLVDYETA